MTRSTTASGSRAADASGPCRMVLVALALMVMVIVWCAGPAVATGSGQGGHTGGRRLAAPMGTNARRPLVSEDQLSFAILSDPSRDPFDLLTAEELADWSHLTPPDHSTTPGAPVSYTLRSPTSAAASSPSTLDEILQRLRAFEDVLYINVRLVGFDGDGEQSLQIASEEFKKYFNVLLAKSRESVSVINPARALLLYQSRAPSRVLNEVHGAMEQHMVRELATIPAWTIEEILRSDYEEADLSHFVLYILNPKKPIDFYAYTGTTKVADAVCKSAIGAGQDRFAWIDISAGPLSYGPLTAGEGVITEAAIPTLKRHPHVQRSPESFMIDLSAFVQRTVDYLVSPSMYRVPIWQVDRVNQVVVHVVLIHDHLVGEAERFGYFDYDAIRKELERVDLFSNETLHFRKSEFSLIDNHLLASVWTNSIKTHTNIMTRTIPHTYVHQYLDSQELHSNLARYRSTILKQSSSAELEIPVFLFDVSNTDILLLDRLHQAISFDDMVIAIQTPLSRVVFDYSCSGRTLAVNPKDATRPTLAALLSTMWGISPTHQAWDAYHNKIKEDYLWAVSSTPYGPFSTSTRLSFAHTEFATRFRLYSYIDRTLSILSAYFMAFSNYNLELEDALRVEAYGHLMQRWNLLQYKFEEARMHLGMGNYNASLSFLLSTRYDVQEIADVLSSAAKLIDSHLYCGDARQVEQAKLQGGVVRQLAMCSTALLLAAVLVSLLCNRGTVNGILSKRNKAHAA